MSAALPFVLELRAGLGPRDYAIWSLHLASRSQAIELKRLTSAEYQAFRAAETTRSLPSAFAISVCFGGWRRACRHAARVEPYDPVLVEAEVIDALYGERHRFG
jgi:hypothetical protein